MNEPTDNQPTGPDPDPDPDPNSSGAEGRWLTRGVGAVGLTSFFSDSGHEMTTAVLPSFLSSTLHAGPGALGVIEGVSDALTGVMKLIGGPLADDPHRRGTLARGGYLITAAATCAIGAATAVWQVAILRAVAWLSRGLRSPARDALLASLARRDAYGRAYGIERAGDNSGAVAGPLLAALLVTVIGIRPTLYLAGIPGLLAALCIGVAAREAARQCSAPGNRARARHRLGELRRHGLVRQLVPIAMFELGNTATTLLILRATDLLHSAGRSQTAATSVAILLYAAYNAVAAVVSTVAGHWLDRSGPRLVLATGAAMYVASYSLFALSWHSWPPLLGAFALGGAGIGLAETAESALVARALPDRLRGSGFGVLGIVQAAGDLSSSALVGLLWAWAGPAPAFAYAAAWMLASALTALSSMRRASSST